MKTKTLRKAFCLMLSVVFVATSPVLTYAAEDNLPPNSATISIREVQPQEEACSIDTPVLEIQ